MNLLLFYLLTSVILATKEVSTSMLLNHFKDLLGQNYSVVNITEDNLNDVLKLMQANTYYYSQIPFPTPSLDTCRKDLTALPPNTDMKQKNYIALYTGSNCIAIMDYIGYAFWKKIGFVTEKACIRQIDGVSYVLLEMYKSCL